jgi:hypothetical protein
MPEYLSPGVFIEEIPSRLKAIEGVSTSTAAFVGPAVRGTVPGYVWNAASPSPNLPFTPTGGFVLTPDPAPVLVTSFAEFQRLFGPPLPIAIPPDPTDYGYLGYAVRAFFDNGGRRAFIARIVDPTARPSTLRVAQGVAYRLVRSAAKGDQTVFLSSTRGLKATDELRFRRHSDGTDALGAPARPATIVGSSAVEPFALEDGDTFSVTPTPPGTAVAVTVVGKPRTHTTSAEPFATLSDLDTLQLQVGSDSAPVQTITFRAGDALTPINPPATTAAQVALVITRFGVGVHASASAAGHVVIETLAHGTAAYLKVMGGTAALKLGLIVGTQGAQAVGSNVPDVGRVTIADIAALPAVTGPASNIAVGSDALHHLRIATTGTGVGASIQVSVVPAALSVLSRLGFGSVTPVSGSPGADALPSTVAIGAYDIPSNGATLKTPLNAALDAGDVYALVDGGANNPVASAGPMFFGRSAGSWSGDVSISIASADRSPVQVTGPVSTAATSSTVPVQSVSSFYLGSTSAIMRPVAENGGELEPDFGGVAHAPVAQKSGSAIIHGRAQ